MTLADNSNTNSPPVAVVIDLAGNRRAALMWAAEHLSGFDVCAIDKVELKWESKSEALRRVREMNPSALAVFSADLSIQSARRTMMLFGALSGASRIVIGDGAGRLISRSRLTVLLIETPLLVFEYLFGYGALIPLSWLLTVMLDALISFRNLSRKMSPRSRSDQSSRAALYLRATIASAQSGGQASHIAGFQRGALGLKHRLSFIASSDAGIQKDQSEVFIIPPTIAVSATRALFELWNNLRFTLAALGHRDECDFIYQRYSRFNWTGVALSVATGLRLALEFNGSEAWISRHWDPVGHLRLLERFERLNLKAADFIFVVSEVERRNLISAGIDTAKVIVNPNGVDPEVFHPECGGERVRRALGVENKIVIGFVGTFGPWHGAPVLAEAATKVRDERCHFLFIGDGDERAICESIIEAAGRSERATFAGRISHDQIPAYLDACDILASPHVASSDGSEFFGSPTKLFEYMAMQRPVVASRLGQIADVIIDGENGLLIEPGDAGELAQAIERLAADENLRARLGAAARRAVAERYTWAQNAARVFEAMEEKP